LGTDKGLTPTEWACIQRAAKGLSRGEIAAEMDVSKETVKGHLASVYRKTGTGSAREAARSLGLLPPLDKHPPRRGITRHGPLPGLPPAPKPDLPDDPPSDTGQPDVVRELPTPFVPFPTTPAPPPSAERHHDLTTPIVLQGYLAALAIIGMLVLLSPYLERPFKLLATLFRPIFVHSWSW